MKIVVFCGGVGTRFWPLSRKALPKQFDTTIFNHKSTFKMAIERILPIATPENIFVSTNSTFEKYIKDQFPSLKPQNLILEPEVRDLAPAVGLITHLLFKQDPDEPFAIIWSDHLVQKPEIFKEMLLMAEEQIKNKTAGIAFLGHTPRFANENLGWIQYGPRLEKQGLISPHKFISWKYRPNKEDAEDLYESKTAAWNLGYFVTTPRFLVEKYKTIDENMQKILEKIANAYDTPKFTQTLKTEYSKLEKISFDDKILVNIKPYEAIVFVSDIGWSDPGTLYALKEALQKTPKANVLIGKCYDMASTDSLVFNRTDNKLVATLGLNGQIVIATNDVIFVCPKEKVPEIKTLIKNLEKEKLDKYL